MLLLVTVLQTTVRHEQSQKELCPKLGTAPGALLVCSHAIHLDIIVLNYLRLRNLDASMVN